MVYHDLNDSTYIFTFEKLDFYFSSNLYREKFIRQYVNYIKDETMKLKLKFKCNINFDEMILLLLYKNIEKRGFRVLYKGKELKDNYNIYCVIK